MSDFPSRLEYSAGLENAPGDRIGRTELVLEADGRARLVHRLLGRERAWTARVELATLASLWAALERGGFPAVPSHPIPGGSAMRTLIAHTGDAPQAARIAWHAAKDLAGYAEAFPILDSIVRQLSEDTVKAAPDTLPPVLSELVREPAPS